MAYLTAYRNPYVMSRAEDHVRPIDVDTVSTDALGIAVIFVLILHCLRDQILRINGERSPSLVLWPIGRLYEVVY